MHVPIITKSFHKGLSLSDVKRLAPSQSTPGGVNSNQAMSLIAGAVFSHSGQSPRFATGKGRKVQLLEI